MPDLKIPRGRASKLTRVDGNLEVGRKATLESSNQKQIVVTGAAYFDGGAEIKSSFDCDSLIVKHAGTLRVEGDLTVRKLLDGARVVDVDGELKAGEIDVGGRLYSASVLCDGRIRVGGTVDVSGTLEAQSVDVAGKVSIGGRAKIQDLNVGGAVQMKGGGAVLGEIKVQGKFEAREVLEFGDLEALGHISLPANSKGRKISNYGKLTAEGSVYSDEIVVKGVMQVRGDCKAQKFESSGKIEVRGSLEAEDVSVWGTSDVRGPVSGNVLRLGGKFRARSILAKEGVELSGDLDTKNGIKSGYVKIEKGSSCAGVIIAERVEVGASVGVVVPDWTKHFAGQTARVRIIRRETKVGEIHSTGLVHLGRSSRCGKIFAPVVELEEGCIVEQVTYTEELRGNPQKSSFTYPPRKVSELPKAPSIPTN